MNFSCVLRIALNAAAKGHISRVSLTKSQSRRLTLKTMEGKRAGVKVWTVALTDLKNVEDAGTDSGKCSRPRLALERLCCPTAREYRRCSATDRVDIFLPANVFLSAFGKKSAIGGLDLSYDNPPAEKPPHALPSDATVLSKPRVKCRLLLCLHHSVESSFQRCARAARERRGCLLVGDEPCIVLRRGRRRSQTLASCSPSSGGASRRASCPPRSWGRPSA